MEVVYNCQLEEVLIEYELEEYPHFLWVSVGCSMSTLGKYFMADFRRIANTSACSTDVSFIESISDESYENMDKDACHDLYSSRKGVLFHYNDIKYLRGTNPDKEKDIEDYDALKFAEGESVETIGKIIYINYGKRSI